MIWRMRSFVIALVLAACGGDGNKQIDAPAPPIDTPRPIDAPKSDSAMPVIDAAVAVGPACDNTTCTNGTEDCCLGTQGNVCVATNTCPTQGFACDGPEDCSGGAKCCYGNGGGGSTCKTTSCQAQACHVDTDCPASAPKCCAKTFTPNYNVCQTAC